MRPNSHRLSRRALLGAATGLPLAALPPLLRHAQAADTPAAPPGGANAAPAGTGRQTLTVDAAPNALIRVPPGVYEIGKPLEILSGQTWFFDNAVIVHNGKGPAFKANANDWAMIGRCRLFGAGVGTADNSGLLIDRSRAYRVSGMDFVGFGGTALQLTDDTELFALPRGDRGVFSDLVFARCETAIDIQPGAEYSLFANTSVRGCKQGIVVAGGNTQFTGGNVVDCEDGIVLRAGKNDSHGGFHGFNINHSKRHSLLAQGVSNGHTFNGCHFYADGPTTGTIYLKDSVGVTIQGGQLDCQVIVEGRRGTHVVANNLVPGKHFSITSSTGDRGRVICRNNTRPDGSEACRAG